MIHGCPDCAPSMPCAKHERRSGAARHVGGISATTIEALADGLVRAADAEVGHVRRDELRDICRLVLRKLRADCPCGFGAEPWHMPNRCDGL